MALKQNTWTLNQWYDQDVAGNVEYTAPRLLYTAGYNDSGELGQNLGYGNSRSSPVQIPGTNWKYVDSNSTDDGYCMGLKTDGTLWGWGRNENGELGINQGGSPTRKSSPTQVGSDTTWSQVTTCGRQDGCIATKTDGTLWVWGHNDQGRLGLNQSTPVKISSPTQLPGTTWPTEDHKIDGDGARGAAIKTDGTLWMWGKNGQGQLGQNDRTTCSSPTQVPGTTWKYIKVNEDGTIATKTDGTLWGWGYNVVGELGFPTASTSRSSPVQVGSDTTWDHIDIGWNMGMGTKTDGTLWTWGLNDTGALGQNDNVKHSSPVQVPGTTWRGPVNADRTAFCSRTDDTMWGWGWNAYGRLGIIKAPGTNFDYYSSPIQIPGGYRTAKTGSPGFTAFIKVQ